VQVMKGQWAIVLMTVALVVLVLLQGNALSSTWANNLASLALITEWQVVGNNLIPPRCQERVVNPEGASLVEKALALSPQNQRVWLNAGRVAWLRGQCQAAIGAWRRAVELAPHDAVARLNLTLAVHSTDHSNDHISTYGDTGIATYCYGKGLQAQQVGLIDDAINWYKLSMRIAPTRLATEALVEYYMGRQQTADAISTWQQLADATPEDDSDHWWALAQAAQLAGDVDTALTAYGRGTQVADNSFDFYVEMGHLQQEHEQYRAALNSYQRAREADSQRWGPAYFQGVVYWLLEDFERAQDFFLTARTLNPRNPYVWSYLGLCAHETGNLPEAIEHMEQAIKLCSVEISCNGEPWHWQWVRRLGDWYMEAGRCEDVVGAYEQALAWQPGEKTLIDRLSTARECLADTEK
jgi:tetratricopeptide (TPR) repeat protein